MAIALPESVIGGLLPGNTSFTADGGDKAGHIYLVLVLPVISALHAIQYPVFMTTRSPLISRLLIHVNVLIPPSRPTLPSAKSLCSHPAYKNPSFYIYYHMRHMIIKNH